MAESIYDKKGRVRPPRVHISYDVELNGAMAMKELPFVIGVMADLSGNPAESLPKAMDRKFTEIDRDNFDDVLQSMKPRLAFKTENTMAGDGSELSVELNFEKMADFRPESIAHQVDPLRELIATRDKLKDLLGRTEGNDRLEDMLKAIIEKDDVRGKLKDALGAGGAQPAGEGGGGGETPPAPETPAEEG